MAEKENKKYYWLRLKEDFFSDDTIRYIEEQENGVYYSNFYLKLCLKSLKTEGRLMRLIGSNLMPYDMKSLANLTGVDIDTVAVAMNLFEKIGLIEIMETGEIYLAQIEEFIGGETEKAALMRRKRAEDKLKSNNVTTISNNVTEVLPERYPEIEIEKEIDIEKEIKESRGKKRSVFTPPTLEQVKEYCGERKNNVDAERFIDFYACKGWMVGKNKMKDWRAAVRNWERGESNSGKHRADNETGSGSIEETEGERLNRIALERAGNKPGGLRDTECDF